MRNSLGRPVLLPDGLIRNTAGLVLTQAQYDADRQRRRRARLARRTESQIAAARIDSHPDGLKRCSKCGRSLPFHAFADKPSERDGLNPRCFGCRPHPDAKEASE